jgi:serine/threonine protein kinase
VYSLAAVIFESTTGRRPFSSKSWIETLSRRLYEPPPNVREVAPDLPATFATVLQQAMDRDPDRRPATAGELLGRLESAISSPNGAVVRVKSWLEPVKAARGIGVGAALIVIVGVAEVVWLFEGSGLTLVQHTLRGWFGGG